jgi:hypothetical protein
MQYSQNQGRIIMAKSLWKDHNRAEASRIIDLLLKRRQKDGWLFDFQNQLYFRSLTALSSEKSLPQGHVMKVLSKMCKDGESSIDGFEKTASKVRGGHLRSQIYWRFVLPVHVKPDNSLRLPVSITIQGLTFRISNWGRYQTRLESNKLAEELPLFTNTQVPVFDGLCMTFQSKGTNCLEAWSKAERTYDLLRGIFEFTTGAR